MGDKGARIRRVPVPDLLPHRAATTRPKYQILTSTPNKVTKKRWLHNFPILYDDKDKDRIPDYSSKQPRPLALDITSKYVATHNLCKNLWCPPRDRKPCETRQLKDLTALIELNELHPKKTSFWIKKKNNNNLPWIAGSPIDGWADSPFCKKDKKWVRRRKKKIKTGGIITD